MSEQPDPTAAASRADEPASHADDHRTRRSFLAAALGTAGAFVAGALGRPATAEAATVVVGANNNETAQTKFTNTAANASAWALNGTTSYTGSAPGSRGVVGISNGQNGVGVAGQANTGGSAVGVLGLSTNGTGVRGQAPHGVHGTGSSSGVMGDGPNIGVYGTSGSIGVYGVGPTGVEGAGSGTGSWGVYGSSNSTSGYGVVGDSGYVGVSGSGPNIGVYGTSPYVGLWGTATATTGSNYGLFAVTASTGGLAGYFSGVVYVSGNLLKAGGGFMVDHPLAPADKYLVHSFVEAPERLNVYSGVVTLGRNGKATVELPDYFEAANHDVRYQLTAIGEPAPNLHVSPEVHGNAFGIAGGTGGQTISWQIAAARQDAWARANPLAVEPSKSKEDRGKYLHPTLHGKSEEDSIHRLVAKPSPGRRTATPPPA